MNCACTIYANKVLNEFRTKNVLVIGDVMVDEYIVGKVRRISPEAPVPILEMQKRSLEAGGASNVAHNLKNLGANVWISGVASNDEPGEWLRQHFRSLGIHAEGIVYEKGRSTTLKTRYTTQDQQLLRMDNEDIKDISRHTENSILAYLEQNIRVLHAVVLSDYKKGVLNNEEFVRKIIRLCNQNNVLVAVDSKSRNIAAFENADFVKPNNIELEEAVGIRIEDDTTLNQAGIKYLKRSGARALVVTRGNKGISLFCPDSPRIDFPAKNVQVFDVCGAGDTVISTILMSLISGICIDDAIELANLAAGIVIAKFGTAAVTQKELVESIYEK